MSDKGRRIDWQEVTARLRASQEAARQNPEDLAAIYRQRALELAKPRERPSDTSATLPVLVFTLYGERFGLELSHLAGLLPFERFTPVPGSPAELLGVMNYRGRICSLFDLALLLQLPPADAAGEERQQGSSGDAPPVSSALRPALSTRAYVLLLRAGQRIGFKVGAVEGLLRIVPGADNGLVESAGPAAPYLKGLTQDRIRLLSAAAILSHPMFAEVSRA